MLNDANKNRRTCFTLLFTFFVSVLTAQEDLKIFAEKKDQGYILFVNNTAYCPMSVLLDLTVENMRFSEGNRKIFVVSAKSEKVKLGELDIETPGEKYAYSFRYKACNGDVQLVKYDTAFAYALPYQKGKTFKMFQGYNGTFSHRNENSLDFTMPEGTEIMAAREGIVTAVVQNNFEGCPKEECAKYNNYITIMHPDGTFANYMHLKPKGSAVKIGDAVSKGQLIAYSGNTGWSSGPHLHFSCWLPAFDKKVTVQTKFKTSKQDAPAYLVEKESYVNDY